MRPLAIVGGVTFWSDTTPSTAPLEPVSPESPSSSVSTREVKIGRPFRPLVRSVQVHPAIVVYRSLIDGDSESSDDEADYRLPRPIPRSEEHPRRRPAKPSFVEVPSRAGGTRSVFLWTPLKGDFVFPNGTPVRFSKRVARAFLETSKLRSFRFDRLTRQIVSMMVPVLITIAVVVLYARLVVVKAAERDELLFRRTQIFQEEEEDPFGTRLLKALANASVVIAAVFGATLLFLGLFLLDKGKYVVRLMETLIVLLCGGPPCYFLYQLCRYYGLPLDYLTLALAGLNLAAAGSFAIIGLQNEASHSLLNKAFLLLVALGIAWPFLEFPEYSVWLALFLLGVYDLFAVLSPCGPLKYLIHQKEILHSDPLPGLMYKAKWFMLGLGDFVFYGTLVGRAALHDYFSTTTCTIAILMGLTLTIVITTHYNIKATPALPASIFLGLVFYVATAQSILPFCREIAEKQLFL